MKQNNDQKMEGRDFIACGIFSLLCMLAMVLAAVTNMSGYTAAFYPAAASFFIGILYVIMINKVKKRGAVLVFSIVPCLYFFTSGLVEGMIGAGRRADFCSSCRAGFENGPKQPKKCHGIRYRLYALYVNDRAG